MSIEQKEPYDEVISSLIFIINELKDQVDSLKNKLAGKRISLTLSEHLDTIGDRFNDFEKSRIAKNSFDRIRTCADHVKTYAEAIAVSIRADKEFDGTLLETANLLQELSKQIAVLLAGVRTAYAPKTPVGKVVSTQQDETIAKALNTEQASYQIGQLNRRIDDLDKKINGSDDQIKDLVPKIKEKLDNVEEIYDNANVEIQRKKEEIDRLLGEASSKVIAGSHIENAANEKKIADILRVGALVCMGLIVVVVGTSLIQVAYEDGLKLEKALVRLIVAVSLSVPAAYLARESTKHRLQQNAYLQTSLDLNTITPYIASLPPDNQHKLKTDIANRLFGSKGQDGSSIDSYPINFHELLVALINKLELPAKKG